MPGSPYEIATAAVEAIIRNAELINATNSWDGIPKDDKECLRARFSTSLDAFLVYAIAQGAEVTVGEDGSIRTRS